jgi:electron-transferring-flavoprotein dehydrogenase
VSTGDKGIDAKGNRKSNFEVGVDIRAKCTVFGEGVRGFLSKQLIPKLGLDHGKHPQTFETGVKEIWECPKGRIQPGMVIHTMGYPLDRKTVGGTFLYGMKNDLLVIGLVVSLDYVDPFLEPYVELQKLKQHPLVSKLIEGGKSVAYGAKAIASGGYYAIPRLYFDGGMIIGESAQLLDMPKLKGIHVGMRSGILAADTIFENFRRKNSFSADDLRSYETALYQSDVGRDLRRGRNFHQALAKGLPTAFLHLAAQEITGGRGWIDPMPVKLDRLHYQTVAARYGRSDAPLPTIENKTYLVPKLTSVFNSGTMHDENQQAHLKIHDTKRCYETCVETWRFPCNRFCPANVYEMLHEKGSWRLQINFTNCVHCQTCDIKCPEDNILWTPPEGGGGPRYNIQ